MTTSTPTPTSTLQTDLDIGALEGSLKGASRKELMEILDITASWAGEKEGKFSLYTPNPIPKVFHASDAKTRAIFGGNRSGKTYASTMDIASQFLGRTPSSIDGLIPEWRLDPTRRIRFNMGDYPNSFSKVIWPLIRDVIPSDEIADVVKESGRVKAITNTRGGFVEFMQYDQDVSKFQGSSRHLCVYDEEPPQSIRDENLMRLVDTDGEEIFCLTPVSGALKWLYDQVYLKASRVVELEPDGMKDRSLPEGDPDIHCFFASIYDNQAIGRKAADRILSKFPDEERIVREKGHFLFLSGLVYKEYSDSVHLVDESDLWYSPETQDDYTLYVAIDPHPRTPHAALFIVVRRDGMKCVVDELFIEATAEELVEAIRIKCRGRRPEFILIDPLANTPDPATGLTFATRLIDAGMNDPMPISAPKKKDEGILKVKETLKPNAEGVPGIYVQKNCTRFRHEITHWAWDDWRKDTRTIKGEKQKPIDKDDHMMENLYRIILMDPQYISPGAGAGGEDEDVGERDFMSNSHGLGRNVVTGY